MAPLIPDILLDESLEQNQCCLDNCEYLWTATEIETNGYVNISIACKLGEGGVIIFNMSKNWGITSSWMEKEQE